MGSLSEGFANLTEALLADHAAGLPAVRRASPAGILISRLLKPLLPGAIRLGPGSIVDLKDRQVGSFDIVGAWEVFPAIGEGAGSLYPADGVAFVLQARDWSVSDLTEYGRQAAALKKLERKSTLPVFCGVISFEPLVLDHVADLLKSQGGEAIDGVLTLGHHALIRNSRGWYGDPDRIPFVSELGAAESLKSFSLFLLQQAQSFVGLPFGMADYQHL
ncbi:MAG: hypothetical protein WC859_08085 [Elusimicrobiota bacterium]|jgi:hypothetical protein